MPIRFDVTIVSNGCISAEGVVKWYAHKSRICRDISIFVGCTKNRNQCNGDGDGDCDAGVTVIALHILRIVELKMAITHVKCKPESSA